MSTERAVPFYCPYCGEEDLRPVEEPHGAWRCAGCLRTFAVKLVGIGVPSLGRPSLDSTGVSE
jgi:ribosomal protein L37AE/L43A